MSASSLESPAPAGLGADADARGDSPWRVPAPSFPERFNLADWYLFDRVAEGQGDRVALYFGHHTYTYAEVADRALRVAAALGQRGLRPGERVYLVLPDGPAFAWSFFGALAAGGVVCLGNPDGRLDDLASVVDYIEPRALICTPSVAAGLTLPPDTLLLVAPDAGTFDDPEAPVAHPGCLDTAIQTADTAWPRPATGRDAPAIWLFTSGSTGRPKAAMHCHRDFAFNTEVYAKGVLGWSPDDIGVSVPRLFFGYATGTNLMFPFAVGAAVGLFREAPTAEQVAWAVRHYAATVLTNVPTLMARLLALDEDSGPHEPVDLSSLRFCLSAGEALPEPLLNRWLARFDVPVYDGIGSAEMFHIYLTNGPGYVAPGSLGRPVPGYTLRLLPPEAEGAGAAEVPEGDFGVLWVKGESVAQGYWCDRDSSWVTFHGPWCRTGDLFRRDEAGNYWFGGRADARLKIAGQWVSPLEVEACLHAHAEVVEAAVVGFDRDGLIRARAFVEVRQRPEGAAAHTALVEALQDWVGQHLSRHKIPREVILVDALPRNDRGKVDKKALPQ